MDSAKRVISGTFGEVWLEGNKVAEIFKFQAKLSFQKEEIQQSRNMHVDTKVTSVKGTGSIGMYKVNSRMVDVIGSNISKGIDSRFTVVSKLADPDSYGHERVSISNVSFDDFTVADWEVGKTGRIEAPFTFAETPKFIDKIGV